MPFKDRIKLGEDTAKFKADQLMRVNSVQTEIEQLRHEIAAQRNKLTVVSLGLRVTGAPMQSELIALCETVIELNTLIAIREVQIANIKAESIDNLPTHSTSTRQCPHC